MSARTMVAALVAVGIWLTALPGHAQEGLQPVPAMVGFIGDPAGVLPPVERERISALLRKLNQDKGSQLGVVIVPTTAPETIEEFAQRTFVTWKLGRKGIDDGVLLVLAPDNKERRMRIHVGYGLEGEIPDAIAKRILVERMRPALEGLGPAAAVSAGVDELLARMANADVAKKTHPEVIEVGPALLRLMIGALAQVPLFAVAVYLLRKNLGLRTRFLVGALVGVAACALYAWVADAAWLRPLALVWLAIPVVIIAGSRRSGGLSRSALRRLQLAAILTGLILAIAAATPRGAIVVGLSAAVRAVRLPGIQGVEVTPVVVATRVAVVTRAAADRRTKRLSCRATAWCSNQDSLPGRVTVSLNRRQARQLPLSARSAGRLLS